MSEGASETKVLFKKRGRLTNTRKRKTSDSEAGSEGEGSSAVVRKEKRREVTNPLKQKTKTKNIKQREKVDYSSDSDEDHKSIGVAYRSSRTAKPEGPDDRGATATIEIDTDYTKDARALFEKQQQINQNLKDQEDDKKYRGLNNYHTYIEKRDTAQGNAASGHVRKGPMRAPANLRATTRWDYAPDICKDYKETGFCGFGDSCKFMHDRSDYKFGWQLEKEWEDGRYNQNEDMSKYEIDSSDDDDLPFKCILCRNSFQNPVVTKCKHYFCEKCALKQFKKTSRCFVCGEQTNGLFNVARDLITKLEKYKAKNNADNSSSDSDDNG